MGHKDEQDCLISVNVLSFVSNICKRKLYIIVDFFIEDKKHIIIIIIIIDVVVVVIILNPYDDAMLV